MRNLWRATAQPLWQHPTLWLPVALADAIALSLSHLQRLLQTRTAEWLMQTHSVLGGRPDLSSSQSSVVASYLISLCLVAVTALITGFIYTTALLAVAAMLRHLANTGRAGLRAAAASIGPELGHALLFSLRLLAISVVAGMIASCVVLLAEWLLKANYFSLDERYTLAESVLSGIVSAYLIAPHAITLLRPADSAPVGPEEAFLAKTTAISAVIVSIAVKVLLAKAVFPRSPHAIQVTANTVASEIAMLPYTALFVALALIAITKSSMTEPQPETHP